MHLIKLSISGKKKFKRAYIPFTISHAQLVTELFNEQKDVKPGNKFPSCSNNICLFWCVFILQAWRSRSHHQLSCLAAHAWALLMQQVRDIQTHWSHERMAFRLLWRKTASCSSTLSRPVPMEYKTGALSSKSKRRPTYYWRTAALQYSPGWLLPCWGYYIVHCILENSEGPNNNFRGLKQKKNAE